MIYLLHTSEMWTWRNDVILRYIEHPSLVDFWNGDSVSLSLSNLNEVGWSSEMMVIQVDNIKVGWVSWSIDRNDDYVSQLCLCILPPYQNRGLGVLIGLTLFYYLLIKRGFRKLEFSCTQNRAFLYEGWGLMRCGTKREQVRLRNGKYSDMVQFELFPDELSKLLTSPLGKKPFQRVNGVQFFKESEESCQQ